MNYVIFAVEVTFTLVVACYPGGISASTVYVSQVSGNDSATCGSQSSPCRTISAGIDQASWGSTVNLDDTKTAQKPYKCQPLSSLRKGIYINKSLSFVSTRSPAYIACDAGHDWVVNGTNTSRQVSINFTGLIFENSRLHFLESSVTVSHCRFFNTENLVLNFTSLTDQNPSNLLFNYVVFEKNEACIMVRSVSTNNKEKNIHIAFNNSVFSKNGYGGPLLSSSIQSTVLWLDAAKKNILDVSIKNTSFKENLVRADGMVYLENKFGDGKFFLEQTELSGNVERDTEARKSLFVLLCQSLTLTVKTSRVLRNQARLLSSTGGVAKITISNMNIDVCIKKTRGGVLLIESKFLDLSIDNCFFSGSGRSNQDSGGAFYISSQNTSFLIKNSNFTNLTCTGKGGVLYISSPRSHVIDSMSAGLIVQNSTFSSNVAKFGGVFYVDPPKFSAEFNDCNFFDNQAWGSGGVMSLRPTDVTTLYFRNVSFVENHSKATFGGALSVSTNFTRGDNPKFKLTASDVNFTDNSALGHGGALFLNLNSASTVVFLERTRFKNNWVSVASGGALYIKASRNVQINLSQCFFGNNSCTSAAGGALYLRISNGSRVNISDTLFKNNKALQAFGGAVLIKMLKDQLNLSECKSSSWRSWIYNNTVLFKNSHFEGNVARGGGAVCLTNGEATFTNCNFVDNFASMQGGHISNYGSSSLQFFHSNLSQTHNNITVNNSTFYLPSFIQTFSAGPLVLLNSTINKQSHRSSSSLIMVSKGGFVYFDNLSSVICSSGSFVSKLNLSYPDREDDSCTIQVTVLRLLCQKCNPGFYSLQRGYTRGLMIAEDFTCIPCPQGAHCFSSIKSKPNFWGYLAQEDPPALNFTVCPLGYCRSPGQSSDGYNSCHAHRQGFMCGACKDGYSEVLLSTECRLSKNCNDHWFWVISAAVVLIIALFFIFKPPFVTFALKQVLWFKAFFVRQADDPARFHNAEDEDSVLRSENRDREARLMLSIEDIQYEKTQTVGFLEIIFYFYQISNLLLTSTSLEQLVKTKIIPPILGFFNFEQGFSDGGLACPFPGLAPQTKKLLEITPVLGTLIAVYVIYGLHCIIRRILKMDAPRFGPYLEATMEILLLGYVTVANVSLSLVRCVPIGSENRWFFNGNLVCFQWWQYALIGFNVIVVVPFMLVLAWGAVKLYHGKISVKGLLIGLVFPLPVLVYWFFCRIRGDVNDLNHDGECIKALKKVLHEPFRKPENGKKGTLYWESVLIGRRFLLVFIYCIITDTSIRLVCMTVVCVLVCLHHSMVKPFRNPHANTAETVSLLALVVLGVINLYKSWIESSEMQMKGSLVPIYKTFEWIEICFLGFIPAVLLIVLALGVVSLFIRMIFWSTGYLYESIAPSCFYGSVSNGRDYSRLIHDF